MIALAGTIGTVGAHERFSSRQQKEYLLFAQRVSSWVLVGLSQILALWVPCKFILSTLADAFEEKYI